MALKLKRQHKKGALTAAMVGYRAGLLFQDTTNLVACALVSSSLALFKKYGYVTRILATLCIFFCQPRELVSGNVV